MASQPLRFEYFGVSQSSDASMLSKLSPTELEVITATDEEAQRDDTELLDMTREEEEGENTDPSEQPPSALPMKQIFLELSRISWPLVITFILELMPGLINVVAVGHLGEVELAAVTLGVMFCQVTGFAPSFGLATAMDTLCSQAFGSNNKKLLGVILQRGLVLEFLLCIPVLILWGFSKQILLAVGQEEDVVQLSSTYVWVMVAGLYPLISYELLKKYLQAQHIVLPQMFVAIIANVWNIFANWLLVYGLNWGFIGAPIARASTNCLLPLLTIAYLKYTKKQEETWPGWSKEALTKWREFLVLGLPGMVMMCLEFWAFEVGAVMAGLLGTTELAAQSIVLNVSTLTYFVPFACSVGTSVVIGNSLGGGNSRKAKQLARASVLFAVCFEVVACILIISLRDFIPYLFTSEEAVVELTSYILPVVAAFQLFDGLAAVAGGVMRGCGRQTIGAVYNFVGFFVIGLPVGASLAFVAGIGLIGLWTGIALALFLIAIFANTLVFTTNWEKQVERALERVRKEI